MLRRAAALLSRCPAAALRGYTCHQPTPPPAPSARQPPADALRHLNCGARGYARMARRRPPTRPDGYSTSDGEADEPEARGREEDDLERTGAGEGGEEGEDAEDSEVEGFMLDLGSGSGSDDEGGDEEEEGGGEERDK